MVKLITILFLITLMISCSVNKNGKAVSTAMPACLQTIVNDMAAQPNGSPQSVSSYTYKNNTVYYMVSPCCDKYNVVYDSACNILGYPDGGLTGKGDGKMNDFATAAIDKKLVWEKK